MRKVRIFEYISLDGVIQAPGARNEDGDYPPGGWAVPYRDSDGGKAVVESHTGPFDLLLGRRTYDIWSGFWPTVTNLPLADSLNAATKYVATHRPSTLKWGPFEGLGPDIVADIRRMKATDGPDLIVWGSSTLTSALLGQGLADEVTLFVYPILLGEGKRLFADDAAPCALVLTGTRSTSSGVLINTYTLAGPAKSSSSAAEI